MSKSNTTEETMGQYMAKSFTQPTGGVLEDFQGVNIDQSVLETYPEDTFFLKELSFNEDGFSTTSSFKRVTSLNTEEIEFGLNEGGRGQITPTKVDTFTGKFAGVGLDGFLTYEAQDSAKGFFNLLAMEVKQTLTRARILEERTILSAFATVELATPVAPVATTATAQTNGAIASGQALSVRCAALTFKGYNKVNPSIQGRLFKVKTLARLTSTKTYKTADNVEHTVNGGATEASLASNVVTTGAGNKNSVSASVDVVPGAAGYAWFIGPAGSERLVDVTYLNSVTINALPVNTLPLASTFDENRSTDEKVFDGIYAQIIKANSGAKLVSLPTGNTGLTSDGVNSVKEIDDMLEYFKTNLNMIPDYMIMSAAVYNQMCNVVYKNGGQSLVTLPQNGDININGGNTGIQLFNTKWGTKKVKVVVHPEAIEGSILFWKKIIEQSVGSSESARISQRRKWYKQDWAQTNRTIQFGVYADEMLQIKAPFAFGLIQNINVNAA